MSSLALRTDRANSLPPYERHKPEQILLYQIIEQHYPTFSNLMEQQGRPLPLHVKIEFNDFLKCGRLEHGFIRVQCTSCHKQEPLREYRVSANQKPRARQNCKLVNKISLRVAAYLERRGFLERDEENTCLQLDGMEEKPMQQLPGHSITYRVAVGAQQG